MCANNHKSTLMYGSESKLINNLSYNDKCNISATQRTNKQKLMRGAIKSMISYVKQIYYLYNHLNDQFLSSTFYK